MHNIAISRLYPHPDNPRQNLGDLSELAESIKANGVLQNLTVVPHDTGYRVVIGHRRLAAARLAGLTEVPCAVVNLSRNEQIALMLAENIQRADLTVYEQAQGIQLMLDLGENFVSISEKTGFSETTVRRRVKLLELDGDKFRQASERGATLMDFARLNDVQSVELRNKVLDTLGTRNFEFELQSALEQEKLDANRPKWHATLSSFATETREENRPNLRYVSYLSIRDNPETLIVPEDAGEVDYFYIMASHHITLMKHESSGSALDPKHELYAAQGWRGNELRELSGRAYELRRTFVEKFRATTRTHSELMRFWLRVRMTRPSRYAHLDANALAKMMGLSQNDQGNYELSYASIEPRFNAEPEKVFLLAAYADAGDGPENRYHTKPWQQWPEHTTNEDLDGLYAALEELGYQMSDDERALQDGTHELFVKPVDA